jgi:hypothetical protein
MIKGFFSKGKEARKRAAKKKATLRMLPGRLDGEISLT